MDSPHQALLAPRTRSSLQSQGHSHCSLPAVHQDAGVLQSDVSRGPLPLPTHLPECRIRKGESHHRRRDRATNPILRANCRVHPVPPLRRTPDAVLPVLHLRRRRQPPAREHHRLGAGPIPPPLPAHYPWSLAPLQVGHILLRLCHPASPAVPQALRRQSPPRTAAHSVSGAGVLACRFGQRPRCPFRAAADAQPGGEDAPGTRSRGRLRHRRTPPFSTPSPPPASNSPTSTLATSRPRNTPSPVAKSPAPNSTGASRR